ncbi:MULTISPECIES: hypothetical protein [unclassified Agrobacterium]
MNNTRFIIRWDVAIDGSDAFITEVINGQIGGSVMFGPMPRDATGPFMDERKEFFEDLVKRERDRLMSFKPQKLGGD